LSGAKLNFQLSSGEKMRQGRSEKMFDGRMLDGGKRTSVPEVG
jgi:hypothetical protein